MNSKYADEKDRAEWREIMEWLKELRKRRVLLVNRVRQRAYRAGK